MARYEITGPDGAKYEVTAPDDASQEQVLSYFQSQMGAQPPPAKQDAGALPAFAGAFNRTIGLPMDTLANAADLATAAVGVAGNKLFGMDPPNLTNRQNIPGTSAWLASKFPSVFMPAGSEEHPYAQAAGAGVGGAMTGGGGSGTFGATVVRPAIAALSNVAGQGVSQATGIPEAGMLASMVTPVGIGAAQNAWQNRASVLPFLDAAGKQAELALRPHTPQEIQAAIELQRLAQQAGSPITSAQALAQIAGSAPRITALENKVYGSQYAPQSMLQEAQQQPGRVAAITQQTAAPPKLGPVNNSLSRANEIEAAADRVMEMPRRVAGATVQPIYDMIAKSRPQLPESVRWSLADKLGKLNEQVGLIEESSAGRAVGGVADTVTKPSTIVSQKGVPFRRAEGGVYELDNFLKELRTRIDRVSSVNPDAKQLVERAGLKPAHAEIRQALIDASPDLKQAKVTYQTTKETLDTAVRRTGIPDMSRRFNADPTAEKTAANWATLEKLITKNQSAADLQQAAKFLSAEDSMAFADVTKNLLGSTLAKSPNPAAFVENVRKIPNIQTAMEIGFRAQGVPKPEAAASGFMKMLNVIEAGTKPRGSLGSEVGQIESSSGGKFGATLAVGHELARKAALLGKIREYMNKNEIETLVSNMNSPRSLENLVNLGKSQPGSQQFWRTLGNLLQPSDNMGLLAAQTVAPTPNLNLLSPQY